MKSVKFSALVAVAVIAASCAKEGTHSVDEFDKVALEPMCIEASDESQTKTVLNGKSVYWTEGDEIAVYSNSDNYTTVYTFPATNINGNSATFSGEVPAETESFFAVYPPKRVASASASGAVVTIPSDQTPAEGTFYEGLNITIAKGTKIPGTPNVGTIRFRNVCSYVKFTVPAYVSDVESVKISSDNAIAGKLTVDYTGENPSSTIAADGEKSISMSGPFGAGKTFIFVIAPGKVSNFRIDITAAKGNCNWTRTVSKEFTAEAGVPNNLGTIHFKQVEVELKPEAKHVYKDGTGALVYQDGTDKTLVGTDIIVNLGLLKYVSNFNFAVKKDGETVRSYSSETGTVASSPVILAWKDYADYPYLPQGEYTIEGSYIHPDDGSTQTISGTFTVPKPTFTVNATGMTSYSYYSKNNIKQANDCQAETIYGIGGTATISQTILDKYPYSASYTLDGEKTDAGEKDGQSLGEHKITATYTFDGVTETSAHTCYVTGLPFLKALPTKTTWPVYDNIDNWSYSTTDGKGIFYNEGGYIQKNFYIPVAAGDTGVAVRINHYGKGRKGSLADATTFNIYAGNAPVYAYTYKSTSGTGETKTANIDTKLTNTNYWVKCSSSKRVAQSTYAMTFNIEVLYR